MLSTRPHLTTLRPSPTTVSFTVSTSLAPQSLASSISHWLLLGLRIFIGILVTLVHLAKYLDPAPTILAFLSDRLDRIPWLHIGIASSITIYLVFLRFHTGMSSRSSYPSFLLRPELIFGCRRISPGPPLPRYSDQWHLTLLSLPTHNALHSYFADPRYLYLRSFSGV